MDENIVLNFWKKYYEADLLDRHKIIEELGPLKELMSMRNDREIDDKLFKHVLIMWFKTYIDDLLEVMGDLK